jgi:tRNA A37 threonylcarbamoyltransferase TsaD
MKRSAGIIIEAACLIACGARQMTLPRICGRGSQHASKFRRQIFYSLSEASERPQKQNASIEAIAFPSWPGFVPAIHVFIASALMRRGCPAQGRA